MFPLGTVSCSGQTIFWGSEGFVRNVDSAGTDWGGGFSLALGVFEQGFIPDSSNRNEWAARWIELDAIAAGGDGGRFASVIDAPSPLPEGASTQVYLWASNDREIGSGPEWLLLTHPAWQWPQQEEPGLPVVWTAGDAEIVVAGTVESGGIRLRSARTIPVPESPGDWLARNFPDLEILPGWHDDADGDGLSQLVEYVLGSDPRVAGPPVGPKLILDDGLMRIELPRNPYAAANISGEVSHDLVEWDPVEGILGTTVDRPDRLEFVELVPSPEGRRFVRFHFHIETE